MAGGPASHTRLESVGSLLVVFVLAEKKGVNQKGKGKFTCGSAGGYVSRRENFYLLAAQASASWEGYTGQVTMEGWLPEGLGSAWELLGSGSLDSPPRPALPWCLPGKGLFCSLLRGVALL